MTKRLVCSFLAFLFLFIGLFIFEPEHVHGASETSLEESLISEAESETKEQNNSDTKILSSCTVCRICPFQPFGVCLLIWASGIFILAVIPLTVAVCIKSRTREFVTQGFETTASDFYDKYASINNNFDPFTFGGANIPTENGKYIINDEIPQNLKAHASDVDLKVPEKTVNEPKDKEDSIIYTRFISYSNEYHVKQDKSETKETEKENRVPLHTIIPVRKVSPRMITLEKKTTKNRSASGNRKKINVSSKTQTNTSSSGFLDIAPPKQEGYKKEDSSNNTPSA